MTTRRTAHTLLAVGILLASAAVSHAQFERRFWDFDAEKVNGFEEGPQRDDVVPGEFLIDPPTLRNLGFRWYITGDSNRNAEVKVAYREADGDGAWREALPMLRVHHEVVTRYFYNGKMQHYRTGNLFAGSVFSLEPGVKYEVRFTMTDPDGGAPVEPKFATVTTRREPKAAKGGRTLHVYPTDAGHERDRATDHSLTFADLDTGYQAAKPGDVILMHAGVHELGGAPYVWKKSGEPGKPIVIRGEGAGRTILEGPSRETDLFRIPGGDHLMFEDLTVRRGAMSLRAYDCRTLTTTTPATRPTWAGLSSAMSGRSTDRGWRLTNDQPRRPNKCHRTLGEEPLSKPRPQWVWFLLQPTCV